MFVAPAFRPAALLPPRRLGSRMTTAVKITRTKGA
jgi:hypothetical protein